MEFSARQISELLGGVIEGNPEVMVNRLSKIEEGEPGTLSFLAHSKYEPFIYSTKASIVLVEKDFVPDKPVTSTLIKVHDVKQSFAMLLDAYDHRIKTKKGIEGPVYLDPASKVHPDVYIGAFTYVGENAVIGKGAKVYPNSYIGDNVVIGENTTIFAGVKIYSDCKIGSNCTIHGGVIIGADGFGFAPQDDSKYQKVPQIGNVVIEDNVEIGANTTIDRATLGSTKINKGVKLDNLIQVAHNVEIGENTVIAAQTGIAGSTKIGRDCMIGGQVGITGHITIADKVKIAAQSGVGANITTPGEVVQGSPSFNISDYKRTYVIFRNLPELEKELLDTKKSLKELQNRIDQKYGD